MDPTNLNVFEPQEAPSHKGPPTQKVPEKLLRDMNSVGRVASLTLMKYRDDTDNTTEERQRGISIIPPASEMHK